MTTLLWVLIVYSAINTIAAIGCLFAKRFPMQTPLTRFFDAIFSLCIGAWALWLLAKGSS